MSNCILFDCDGTLVDSERLSNIGLVRKFEEYGIQLDADELVKEFRGWKFSKILEALQARFCVTLADDFIESYRTMVAALFKSELKPIAHIEYALENLTQSKAVVSNGPREKIEQALDICGLTKYFGTHIYSSYEIGVWKPDPQIYRYAAVDMGFTPQQCAVVDDGLVGVEAGYRAGINTFFYNRQGEPCQYANVVSFNSMQELPGLVAHTWRQ